MSTPAITELLQKPRSPVISGERGNTKSSDNSIRAAHDEHQQRMELKLRRELGEQISRCSKTPEPKTSS